MIRLHNSIRIDGSVFIARGTRIIAHRYLPHWAVISYCCLAEKLEAK